MSVKNVKSRNKEDFISYENLKKYVREQGIKTKDEFLKIEKTSKVDGLYLPYNPSTFYSKDMWEGWSIFLRGEIYKKKYNGTYYSYQECKKEILKFNLVSKSDFVKRIKDIIKIDIRVPYSPSTVYKNEWEGWSTFLNNTNNTDQIKELTDFNIAREYAIKLNLKLSIQWYDIKFEDLPIGMTKNPRELYKNKGWIDWFDFLGIDKKTKMSYGELIISKYLDNNGIKFNYNKSLKDCISSSKLRFDFYLPDYNTCIEFDGKQHFESVDYFGGEEEFEKVKIRDDIKNKWCLVNDIKLIRFNYKQSEEEIIDYLSKNIL